MIKSKKVNGSDYKDIKKLLEAYSARVDKLLASYYVKTEDLIDKKIDEKVNVIKPVKEVSSESNNDYYVHYVGESVSFNDGLSFSNQVVSLMKLFKILELSVSKKQNNGK